MGKLLRVKSVLLLLATAGLVGGWKAAQYPGPPVERSEARRTDKGVSSWYSIGPDYTFPLLAASYGFLGFGAVCAAAAAWVHVTEVQTAGLQHRTPRRAEGEGWELAADEV